METLKIPHEGCPLNGYLEFVLDKEINGKEFYQCTACGKWIIADEIDLTFTANNQIP